jgi:hypothetical protein
MWTVLFTRTAAVLPAGDSVVVYVHIGATSRQSTLACQNSDLYGASAAAADSSSLAATAAICYHYYYC